MILCVCRGLSDAEIRETIAEGARSVDDLAEACGAGADCRVCCEDLERLIADVRRGVYSGAGRTACPAGRSDT